MTIREIISGIQTEIGQGDLLPGRAAELLNILSSLIGNCNDEIRKRDVEYSKVLLKWLDIEHKANRAKIQAEITPEFEARQIARNTKELTLELIRSLKYFLKAKEEELNTGKYQ